MASLGRKGGLVGGPARARALTPRRRAAIARKAALRRWSRRVLQVAPSAGVDLASFVAHVGSSVTPAPPGSRLERVVLRALKASHRDAALARMLPVFLWRVRGRLDLPRLVLGAARAGEGAELGFFLEAASRLGGGRRFDAAVASLRRHARPAHPSFFFAGTRRRPFERMAAEISTPDRARRWGLLMNMPWESFASHFDKVARL